MPTEPIEYQIVLDVQAALKNIAVANGYYFDVAALEVKLDPNHDVESLIKPDGPRPFLIVEVRPDEQWEYTSKPNIATFPLPLTIHWVSDTVPTVDESRLQTYFRGCADVEKAIAQDVTRGGRARDTLIV